MTPQQFFGATGGGMPSMPVPSLSAGGGGPSTSGATGGAGFDASGWSINFGTQGLSPAAPMRSGVAATPFALPFNFSAPIGASVAGGGGVSPLLLIAGAVALYALLRKG